MLNRRSFLALSISTGAHAALAPSGQGQRGAYLYSYANSGLPEFLRVERVGRLVGTDFKVRLEDGSVARLKLEKIVARKPQKLTPAQSRDIVAIAGGSHAKTRRMLGYTATFRVSGRDFSQNTYTLDSASTGPFSIFLVPHPGSLCHSSFSYFDGDEFV